MTSCSKCSRENPDDVDFCVFCGNKFGVVCINCGRENIFDAVVCGYCGTSLALGTSPENSPLNKSAIAQPAILDSPEKIEEIKGKVIKIHNAFYNFGDKEMSGENLAICLEGDINAANVIEKQWISASENLRIQADHLKKIWSQGNYCTSRMIECCDVICSQLENTKKIREWMRDTRADKDLEQAQRYMIVNRELGPRIDTLLIECFDYANKTLGLKLIW